MHQDLFIPTRPAAPNVTAIQLIAVGGTGGIRNTTNAMEYRLGNTGTWMHCSTPNTIGLQPGTYQVRYRAITTTPGAFASFVVTPDITIVNVSTIAELIILLVANTNMGEKESVNTTVEIIKGLDTGSVAAAKANPTDTRVADALKALEVAYKAHNNITVPHPVIYPTLESLLGFSGSEITLVGAGKNATSGPVALSLSMPQRGIAVRSAYTKDIRLNMTLSGNGVNAADLCVPVTITMPIPNGIDANQFRIIHFGASGSTNDYVLITPRINGSGVNRTATFTLTGFSEFAFVELMAASKPWQPPDANNRFIDVPNNNWQNAAVSWADSNGITTGSPAGSSTFKPNDTITRAEFVTFLHRIYGIPSAPRATFSDMPANPAFQNAISWAFAEGITTGSPAGSNTFMPNDNITREQIAAMLYRYVGGGTPVPVNRLSGYTDQHMISTWAGARDAVNWAVHNGIMGQNINTLNPRGNATRAEAVTMLYRVVEIFNIPAP